MAANNDSKAIDVTMFNDVLCDDSEPHIHSKQ